MRKPTISRQSPERRTAGGPADAAARPKALVADLKDLTRLIQRVPGFPEIIAALRNGKSATVDGAWGSASALIAAALGLHAPSTLVAVLAHVGDVDDFRDDVATFAGVTPEVFPAWDRLPREMNAADEIFGRRLRVAKKLLAPEPPRLVIAPFQAMLQPVPKLDVLSKLSRTLKLGDILPVEHLTAWLNDFGMTRAEVVEVPGEFSVRGGIVDIFPTDSTDPVRIEFFGDEVESIRPFDVESQRSLDRWTSVTITAPLGLEETDLSAWGHAADFSRRERGLRLLEPDGPSRRGPPVPGPARRQARPLHSVDRCFERLIRLPTIAISTLSADSLEATCHLRIESIERFSGDLNRVKDELDSAAAGENVLMACHNAAEVERLGEVFSDTEPRPFGPAASDRRPHPCRFPLDRRPDAGHWRPRAFCPRRGPPAGHAAAV